MDDKNLYLIKNDDDRAVITKAHMAALDQRKKMSRMIEERGRVTSTPELDLPEGELRSAVILLQKYTAPIDLMACRRRIEQLRKVLGASRMTDDYVAILARAIGFLPEDLIDQGMIEVIRNRAYKAMPAPAEWTGPVEPAFRRRQSLLRGIHPEDSGSACLPSTAAEHPAPGLSS